jgi:hypothetical protein
VLIICQNQSNDLHNIFKATSLRQCIVYGEFCGVKKRRNKPKNKKKKKDRVERREGEKEERVEI